MVEHRAGFGYPYRVIRNIGAFFCSLTFLSMTLFSQSASAVDISILAGTDFTRYSYEYTADSFSQGFRPGMAFGATANYALSDVMEFETGFIFMLRRLESTDTLAGTSAQRSSLRAFQIPAIVRVPFLKYFAFGGGAYYTQGFDRLQRRGGTMASSGEPGYSDSNTSKMDFGAVASLQTRVLLTSELKGIIDLRYLHGLANVDTTGLNTKMINDFQIMLGMTIGGFK